MMMTFEGYSKFEKILMQEGYSKEDARSKLVNVSSKITPSYFFEELPKNLDFLAMKKGNNISEKIFKKIINNMHITELTRQSKDILRYMDYWTDKVDITTVNKLFNHLLKEQMGPNLDILAFNFALYINNILENDFVNDNNKNKVISSIDSFGHYIPFFANQIGQMPLVFEKRLDSITRIDDILETDAIKSLIYAEGNGIYCIRGRKGHHNSIVAPFIEMSNREKSEISKELYQPKFSKNEGKVTLVYIDDILIGSIKIRKNPNLLALRTVRDSKGRYPLVLGGVYGLHDDLIDLAEKEAKKQGKWARIDLKTLRAYPIKHISQEDFGLVHRSFKPYNEELIYVRNKIEKK